MKTITRFLGIVLSVLGFSMVSAGARPANLADFAGNFTGTASLTVSGTTATGPAQVRVVVPRSGDYALFRISGSVSASGTTLSLNNTFVFLSPKALVVEDLVFGITPVAGVNGSFTSNARALKYNLPFSVTGTSGEFAGVVRTKTVSHTQTLTIQSDVSTTSGGVIYSFVFTVSRHIH